MTKKLKNFTDQEKEISRLRRNLVETSMMIADYADESGLSTSGCIKVLKFINEALKGAEPNENQS